MLWFFSLEGRPVSGVVRKFKCPEKKRSLLAQAVGLLIRPGRGWKQIIYLTSFWMATMTKKSNISTMEVEGGLWSISTQSTDEVGFSILSEPVHSMFQSTHPSDNTNSLGHINRPNSQQTCCSYHILPQKKKSTMLHSTWHFLLYFT
jgi:hypothetical protein